MTLLKSQKSFFLATLCLTTLLAGCTSAPRAQTTAEKNAEKNAEKPAAAVTDESLVVARRPSFPFRVWYAGAYSKNPERYPHLTLETSGRGDARTAENQGVSHLNWVYGTQISWNAGAKYWVEHAGVGRRTAKPNAQHPYPFLVSGYSVDEWTGSSEEKRRWVVEGLREAKKQNPEMFIAIWVAGVSKEVAELAREGTVDLIMVQAYNLTKQRGIGVSWQTGIDRMDVAKKEGLEHKTVFGFGHVTSDPNWKGGFVWTEELVRERMAELKTRYPKMPGISFFEAGAEDPVAHAQTVQLFDRLSAEYWPDSLPLDGTFSLTPQSATQTRLRLPGGEARTGAKAVVGESELDRAQLWNFVPQGEGTYRIQAPYDDSLVLTAGTDGSVALQKAANGANQKWNLAKVVGGYTIAPQSAPNSRLESVGAAAVQLAPAKSKRSQIWALAPEYLLPPQGTTIFTTNQGVAGDTSVQPNRQNGRDPLLAIQNERNLINARKAYLRFDLTQSPEAVETAHTARLTLTLADGRGNSPADKTWTFRVYGVNSGAEGNWSETDVKWEDAPANDVSSANGVTDDATWLGSFSVRGKGREGDTATLESSELVRFIQNDDDGLVTFIIVREEANSQGNADNVVHLFGTRNNPRLASPTLTLTTQN